MMRFVLGKHARMVAAGLVLGLSVLIPAGSGLSHTSEAAGLQVIHPWAEPGKRGATTKAYPTFVNPTDRPQVISGISAEAAARVEIVAGGEVIQRLELAPGETLGIDQVHLRLTGLKRDLDDGEHFGATLRLAGGKTAEIMMVVGESTQAAEM